MPNKIYYSMQRINEPVLSNRLPQNKNILESKIANV